MPVLSDRVGTFTDSVIRRMTRINNQYNSINLSQGFPDFHGSQGSETLVWIYAAGFCTTLWTPTPRSA